MKKYLRMLPIILYPYCFIIIIVICALVTNLIGVNADYVLLPATLIMLAFYNIYTLVIIIANIVKANKWSVTARDMAKMNMIVKLSHIPGYIFYFVLGFFSLMLSVWGIGFLLWAIISDLCSIFISGLTMIAAAVAVCKEEKISKGSAVLFSISGFIYVIDVVTAIVLFVTSNKQSKKQQNEATPLANE